MAGLGTGGGAAEDWHPGLAVAGPREKARGAGAGEEGEGGRNPAQSTGSARGQDKHSVVEGRAADSTPSFIRLSVRLSIPARCEHNPPRACFGVGTRSWFTAYETKGTGVAHLCPASFPPAGIGFPGHTAFPPRRAAPRSPGSISPLIKCQAAAQPCSPSTPKSKLIFLRLQKCTSSLLPALRP